MNTIATCRQLKINLLPSSQVGIIHVESEQIRLINHRESQIFSCE